MTISPMCKNEEEDEIELRAIAASAVNSPLPQAATQQACMSYAEYKCLPLLKRIAELEAFNEEQVRTIAKLMDDTGTTLTTT